MEKEIYLMEEDSNISEDKITFETLEDRDEDGNTVLHRAVEDCDLEYIQFLLDAGADVNARNKSGETPAHIVARIDADDVFQLLLEYGADIYIRNNSQKTSGDLSRMMKGKKITKIFENYTEDYGYTEKIRSYRKLED